MKAAICERPVAISPNMEKIAQAIKTAATRTLRRSNGRKLAASTVAPTTKMDASASLASKKPRASCNGKLKMIVAPILAMNPITRLRILPSPRAIAGRAPATVMKGGITTMKRNHERGEMREAKISKEAAKASNRTPCAQRSIRKPTKQIPITRIILRVFMVFIPWVCKAPHRFLYMSVGPCKVLANVRSLRYPH